MRETALRSKAESPSQATTAELLHLTGRNQEARLACDSVVTSARSTPDDVARCLEILGAIAVDAGDNRQAVEFLAKSAAKAAETGNWVQLGRTQIKLIPPLSDLPDPSRLAAVTSEARRTVLRVGDPHLMAQLHLRFGQLEAKKGSLDRALRHFNQCWHYLEHEPNCWVDGLVSLDASGVWSYLGDTTKGTAFANRALECSRQSGHERTRIGALANLCLLRLQQDEFGAAEKFLAQALPGSALYPRIRLALLDTAAQIALRRGDLDMAQANLAVLEDASRTSDTKTSWLWIAASATRVRLLLAQRQWERAISTAEASYRAADARRDRILGAGLRLLQADGYIGAGRTDDASRVIGDVLSDTDGLPASTLAGLLRVRAKSAGPGAGPTRDVLWQQARTITDRLGTTGAKHDFVRDADSFSDFGQTNSPGRPSLSEDDSFGHALESTLVLLSLGSAPAVLLESARQLLEQLHAVKSAVVASACSSHGEARATPDSSGLFRVSAGQGTDALVLVAQPRDHRHAPLVRAVVKLAAAATELHEHRVDLARRTPLWPVEQSVDRGIGVFAAPVMQQLLSTIDSVAGFSVTVLITGETGVGKEVIANEVHRRSANPGAPFVAFNCASVPRDMLESQLFGYKRGAFTGATDNSPGIIRTASGGTLFLDEVGEMSPELQPKILRFLENAEIHPLGEGKPLTVPVRVVAATNLKLDRAVREGRFREDLYYRLNVVQLHVPPLRERREEIPLLANHFLSLYAKEFRKAPLTPTDEALEALLLHDWPGNVRQLANELRRIVALTPGGTDLVPGMLSPEIRSARRRPVDPEIVVSPNEVAIRIDQPLDEAVAQLERATITRALEQHGGRLETAAEMLGLSRKGLFLKRKRYGLD